MVLETCSRTVLEPSIRILLKLFYNHSKSTRLLLGYLYNVKLDILLEWECSSIVPEKSRIFRNVVEQTT